MLDGDAERGHCQTFSTQVGENSYCYAALAKYLHYKRRCLLSNSIYDIGTHTIAHINKKFHNYHGVINWISQSSNADIFNTATSLDHVLTELVCMLNNLLLACLYLVSSISNVLYFCDLNLRNHNGRSRLANESGSFLSNNLSNCTACSDYTWFFNSHRYHVALPIDLEAETKPEGQRHYTNAVFDHVIGDFWLKSTTSENVCI